MPHDLNSKPCRLWIYQLGAFENFLNWNSKLLATGIISSLWFKRLQGWANHGRLVERSRLWKVSHHYSPCLMHTNCKFKLNIPIWHLLAVVWGVLEMFIHVTPSGTNPIVKVGIHTPITFRESWITVNKKVVNSINSSRFFVTISLGFT